MPEAAEPDEAENTEPEPVNRAERRAQARGKKSPEHGHDHGKGGPIPGGRGSVQGPRQYGRRRSG